MLFKQILEFAKQGDDKELYKQLCFLNKLPLTDDDKLKVLNEVIHESKAKKLNAEVISSSE